MVISHVPIIQTITAIIMQSVPTVTKSPNSTNTTIITNSHPISPQQIRYMNSLESVRSVNKKSTSIDVLFYYPICIPNSHSLYSIAFVFVTPTISSSAALIISNCSLGALIANFSISAPSDI